MSLPPNLPPPGAGWLPALAGAALLLALLAAAWWWRRDRGRRVRRLAARGATPSEIAQRTGLPRDAVRLLLSAAAAQTGEIAGQNSPLAEASAAPAASRARHGRDAERLQAVLRQRDAQRAAAGPQGARALPFLRAGSERRLNAEAA